MSVHTAVVSRLQRNCGRTCGHSKSIDKFDVTGGRSRHSPVRRKRECVVSVLRAEMAVDFQVESVDSGPHLAGPAPEKIPYGDRVALSLAKDAALNALERADRWRQRCVLAERELGAVSDATDTALDRLEAPAEAAAILLEQLAGALAQLSAREAHDWPDGDDGIRVEEYAQRRLSIALERERAARREAERALQEERLSHAKTRQRLVVAETGAVAGGSALVVRAGPGFLAPAAVRPAAGEPERRRQQQLAQAAGERVRLQRAFVELRNHRQQMLGVRAALLLWSEAGVARAFRAIERARLASRVRQSTIASGLLLSAQSALVRWRRRVRGEAC